MTSARDAMDESTQNEWVEVFFTYDQVEANILMDLLKSGGIDVVERSNKVSPYPVNIGRMGEVRLLVRKQDEADARQFIMHEG